MSARHRSNLKMTPEHYERLRLLMLNSALKDARTERERWDALWRVYDWVHPKELQALMGELYGYLTDAHIDSALRHIVAGSVV